MLSHWHELASTLVYGVWHLLAHVFKQINQFAASQSQSQSAMDDNMSSNTFDADSQNPRSLPPKFASSSLSIDPLLCSLALGYLRHCPEFHQEVLQCVGAVASTASGLYALSSTCTNTKDSRHVNDADKTEVATSTTSPHSSVMQIIPSVTLQLASPSSNHMLLFHVAQLVQAYDEDVQIAALHAVASILEPLHPSKELSMMQEQVLLFIADRSPPVLPMSTSSSSAVASSASQISTHSQMLVHVTQRAQASLKCVFALAKSVVEETRFAAMHVLSSLSSHAWGMKHIVQQAALVEFLLDRKTIISFGKLEADWKFKIVSNLRNAANNMLMLSSSTSSSFSSSSSSASSLSSSSMTVNQLSEANTLISADLYRRLNEYVLQGVWYAERQAKVMDPEAKFM
jgi:hypothetical protein